MSKKVLFLIFVLVIQGFKSKSQILDDSTQLVYGPASTLSITESDIFYQRSNWQKVDTLLTNFYKFSYPEKYNFLWQDLGVIGTSLRPIYPIAPSEIGATPGYETYAPYFKSPSEFKYYDTKSPHIIFSLMLGGKGRSIVDVLLTRNINPQFNIGIHLKKLTIDNQIGNVTEGDRQVESSAYDGFASYTTKNKRYKILANYSRIRHIVSESGGVEYNDSTTFAGLFDDDAVPKLDGAKTIELRRNIHTYQQFGISPLFQAYHKFDRFVQQNSFSYIGSSMDTLDFFDHYYINSDTTQEENRFNYFKNEVGLKGKVGRAFYNVYYKHRWVDQYYRYLGENVLDFPLQFTENYGGVRFGFDFDSLTYADASFEYLSDGNFQMKGDFNSKLLDVEFSSSLVQPSFIQRTYFGNHDAWFNYFKNPSVTQLSGNLKFRFGTAFLSPGISVSQLGNYIYFNQDTIPDQTTKVVGIVNPSLKFSVKLPLHFQLSGQGIYTIFTNGAESYLHIPELFVNGELYYKNKVFKGALETQIGINFHWNSAYYADNYYPIMQQYFLQDRFKVAAPFKMDLYLSGRLKSAMLFLKFVNLKQMFTKVGNLVGPYYPGQRYSIDFGFTWFFYD